MSRFVDNIIAYRILSMLVKNFEDTEAFKLGIIDKTGKSLKKPQTSREHNAYTYLHKLVFNMKKIINRLPGGESKLKSLVTALFLIKEYYESNNKETALMEQRFNSLYEMDLILAEEQIIVEKYFKDIEEDAPANATGAGIATDRPAIKQKDINKYKLKGLFKR